MDERRCGESDDDEDMIIGSCCIRALRFRPIIRFIAMYASAQIMSWRCVWAVSFVLWLSVKLRQESAFSVMIESKF